MPNSNIFLFDGEFMTDHYTHKYFKAIQSEVNKLILLQKEHDRVSSTVFI